MSDKALVATITGTDDWLRSHLMSRLSTAGISAKDGGRGSAALNGTDVLVILPALFPLSASPARDGGVAAAAITLGAVVTFGVSRVVLLSRVHLQNGSLEGRASVGRTGPRTPWSRRHWRRSVEETLAHGSEASRKYAPPIPMQLRAVTDVWP